MEKYARQAVSEGVKNVEDLRVGGDSEIYRVLNLHYNRNNHIEVWGPQVRNTNTHTLHFILFSSRYCFSRIKEKKKDREKILRETSMCFLVIEISPTRVVKIDWFRGIKLSMFVPFTVRFYLSSFTCVFVVYYDYKCICTFRMIIIIFQ